MECLTKSDFAMSGECMFNSQSATKNISVNPNFKNEDVGREDLEVDCLMYFT